MSDQLVEIKARRELQNSLPIMRHALADIDWLIAEVERLLEFEETDHTGKDLVVIATLSHENVKLREENAALRANTSKSEQRRLKVQRGE